MVQNGDVPSVLRFDGKKWPLGRYLKEMLREQTCGVRERSASGVIRYTPGYVAALVELQEECRFVVGREAREDRRKNHALSADARVKISQSKKGIL